MELLEKTKKSLKSRGIYGTLKWGFLGYFRENHFIVYYRDLDVPINPPAVDSSIQISKISISELIKIRNKLTDLPVEFSCDITHGFTTPYILRVGGELAAIHWLVQPGEKSRFLNLKAGDLELNFNTVLPEFRRKRLAEILMASIIERCSKQHKRIFGVVHVSNIPQYKQMIRLGFEPIELVTHFAFHRPKATLKYI